MKLNIKILQLRREMPDTKFKKVYTFNSARKSMSTIIPLEGGGYRVYTKGASEIIMKKCSFIVVEGGKVESFTTAHQDRLVQTVIEPMAKDGLRTISIAYRDFVPNRAEKNQVHYDANTGKMGFLGLSTDFFVLEGISLLWKGFPCLKKDFFALKSIFFALKRISLIYK